MSSEKQQGFEEMFMRRPASIGQLIDDMSYDVYDSLKLAVQLQRWGDGERLNAQQVEFCMQAIILYEAKHLPEQDRIGFDLSVNCESKSKLDQAQPISLLGGSSLDVKIDEGESKV